MTRPLGKTGKSIYPIGFGAMGLSIEARPEERQSIAVIHAALEAGIQLIDTADAYCLDDNDLGHNERLIRRAIGGRLEESQIVIATKGGLRRPDGEWVIDATPARLRSACEQSLRNLETESIFLYYLHSPDPNVPFEDSLGELCRLQEEGKIRHIGLSNVNEEELLQALELVRVEAVQNRCNPYQQSDLGNGMVELCEKHEITYVAYSPVGGRHGNRTLAQHPVLQQLSEKYAASPHSLTLAWLLSKNRWIIPIPGATKPESIIDSAKAATLKIDASDLSLIDALSPLAT